MFMIKLDFIQIHVVSKKKQKKQIIFDNKNKNIQLNI